MRGQNYSMTLGLTCLVVPRRNCHRDQRFPPPLPSKSHGRSKFTPIHIRLQFTGLQPSLVTHYPSIIWPNQTTTKFKATSPTTCRTMLVAPTVRHITRMAIRGLLNTILLPQNIQTMRTSRLTTITGKSISGMVNDIRVQLHAAGR